MKLSLTKVGDKYRLQNETNEADFCDFDTAQEAIDFREEVRPDDDLEVTIDHRIYRGYFG